MLRGISARADWAHSENLGRHLQHLGTSALHLIRGEKKCSGRLSRLESQHTASAHSEHPKSIRRT